MLALYLKKNVYEYKHILVYKSQTYFRYNIFLTFQTMSHNVVAKIKPYLLNKIHVISDSIDILICNGPYLLKL